MKRIYLDNNATTPLDPLVLKAMQTDLNEIPANPSSIHYFGQEAKKRLNKARHYLADYFNVKPSELIFTSGGTEAINLILKGLFPTFPDGEIITSDLEHAAVYNTLRCFEKRGGRIFFLKGGQLGAISPQQVKNAITPNTKLIALTAANSETGVKTDIEAIAQIAHEHKIFLFVDGVALLGKESFTIPQGVSAMSFSGHKIHGPKGSGLALLRHGHKLEPLFHGGGQEYGMRSGTENMAAIIGFTKAIELIRDKQALITEQMQSLRDYFEKELQTICPLIQINGNGKRIPNTSNISFPSFSGEDLLIALDQAGIAVSHGSACSSGALEPSRVLINMGIPKKIAASAIRFSLSRNTTKEEIDKTLQELRTILTH
jgi:cysteine desulfurase